MYMPHVHTVCSDGTGAGMDLCSKLVDDRIIFLSGEINDATAEIVVSELLYLAAVDPTTPITMYINSPGGAVTAGMAIYDTMCLISPDVITVCVGLAASMGAVLLAGGTKGKRYCLPHSTVMIHQPLTGVQGQASDVEIVAQHVGKTKALLNQLLSDFSGQSLETIAKDTDRDNYMTAEEAVAYGLVDSLLYSQS